MSDASQPQRPDFSKPPAGEPEQQYGPQYGQPPYAGPYGQDPARGHGQEQPPRWPGPVDQYAPRPLSPQDERTWSLVAHLSWLAASFVGLPFVGPLVVYLVLKDRSRFVRGHAAEALNLNIALIVYSIALTVLFTILTIVTLGVGAFLFGLIAVPWIAGLVFSILAAVAANQGRTYRYPLIFRLVR